MPKVTINGVGINYESDGEGFPARALLLPGRQRHHVGPQVEAFSRNYRFIRFEPRGHGRSDAPHDPSAYGLDTSVEDLLRLLDHLGIEKAYVGGLFMGGGITTRFTLLHPDRVAGLLVIDSGSASGHAHAEEIRARTARVRELAFTEGMEAVAQYSIWEVDSFALRAGRGPEAAEGIVEMIKGAHVPHGYVLTLEALDQAPAFDDRLSEIKAPTLCIAGDEGPGPGGGEVRPRARSRARHSWWCAMRGHFTNLDQTETFNREVLAFLARVDAQRA